MKLNGGAEGALAFKGVFLSDLFCFVLFLTVTSRAAVYNCVIVFVWTLFKAVY